MADQGKEGLLSPYLRNKRIKAAQPFLKGRVLDFGCGSGALAALIPPSDYCGIDRDPDSLEIARNEHPEHRFDTAQVTAGERFDTVVSLAVIEHVADPAEFLHMLKQSLVSSAEARIVCTTPHPAVDWVHTAGAKIGLFSASANEEHEALLNRDSLRAAGQEAGLEMAEYHRFLFGANQIVVFKHNDI
jgi:2-polyprenyl-3-methyl-5-hydroxy-6-metoxy-1,4-benzoquinol methylase